MRVLRALPLLLAACISPDDPPTIRYFSVDEDRATAAASAVEASAAEPGALRLRTVRAAGHLGDRIVWRISPVEYGFYELRRWTESPVAYVTRALEFELFEVRALRSVESGAASVLEVELVAFEEVLEPGHAARVAVVVQLRGRDGRALVLRTFEEQRPVVSDDPADLARVMSAAMTAIVNRIAEAVQDAVVTVPSSR